MCFCCKFSHHEYSLFARILPLFIGISLPINKYLQLYSLIKNKSFIFAFESLKRIVMAKKINRIKVVLVEKGVTSKWLAEQLGKNVTTVSKWCTNDNQPNLETLLMIARLLNVEVQDLIAKDAEI